MLSKERDNGIGFVRPFHHVFRIDEHDLPVPRAGRLEMLEQLLEQQLP